MQVEQVTCLQILILQSIQIMLARLTFLFLPAINLVDLLIKQLK